MSLSSSSDQIPAKLVRPSWAPIGCWRFLTCSATSIDDGNEWLVTLCLGLLRPAIIYNILIISDNFKIYKYFINLIKKYDSEKFKKNEINYLMASIFAMVAV